MFSSTITLNLHLPTSNHNSLHLKPHSTNLPTTLKPSPTLPKLTLKASPQNLTTFPNLSSNGSSRMLLLGATTLGLALLVVGEAHAMGPEGPLVEEFWDNMRRYGLYALTVTTGVASAVLEPIVELLKNPITAVLIITILVGSGFLVSQILSLMVGTSEFAYEYAI